MKNLSEVFNGNANSFFQTLDFSRGIVQPQGDGSSLRKMYLLSLFVSEQSVLYTGSEVESDERVDPNTSPLEPPVNPPIIAL